MASATVLEPAIARASQSLRRFAAALLLAVCAQPAMAAKLTVVTEEFAPFNYTRDGRLNGYAVEVVQELLARARLDYSIASYPWSRAYEMATRMPDVLIFSMARGPEREDKFTWIAPLARRHAYLYKLAARHDINLRDIREVANYRVATNRGNFAQAQLQKLGQLPSRQIDLSNVDQSNLKKLIAGRVDFIVATEDSVQALCATAGVPLAALERSLSMPGDSIYFLAASLATPPDTVQRLRDAYEQLQKTPFIKRAAEKYNITPAL